MIDREIAFTNYIESFKKQDIIYKKKEIINSLKELIAVFDALATESNINIDYLNEIKYINLDDKNISDDDFLDASIIYLESAKDIIGQYLNFINKF
jgi:patatin-like phospholipase/acyl hydrolase